MVFEFIYTPDPVVGLLNDPTILEIADVCGITSRYVPRGRNMQIDYNAKSRIAIFSPLMPSIDGTLHIRCPFSQSSIDKVVSDVEMGMSPQQAIKDADLIANTSFIDDPLKTKALTTFGSLVQLVGPVATPPPANYYPQNISQIGTGTHDSIFFPSKTWINYTMVFQFKYTPDPYVGLLHDPAILELADVCGITSRYTPRRPMRISYDARSVIGILKPLGYEPSISGMYFTHAFSRFSDFTLASQDFYTSDVRFQRTKSAK
ncbi:hypothetical protein HDU98_012204 [Podochytrium sp. JEL0797]|nr:hypothetical protein HDU98_012204 [Podochytrium sp. JEL0797]